MISRFFTRPYISVLSGDMGFLTVGRILWFC